MSELIIPSTPNWFLNNCICVGADGFVIYGTLSVGIAILTPSETKYIFKNAKIIKPAHKERVTCLSLCPDWVDSRNFISGSDDGFVKLWNASTLTSTIGHNTHLLHKETVIGAAFLDAKRVFALGNLGVISIWNINSNCVQSDKKILKTYKPSCLNICPHKPNIVALGTKQGVVIVLSIEDTITILYKGPGHDTEITSLSWCPTINCEYFDNSPSISKLKKKNKTHISKKDGTELNSRDENQIQIAGSSENDISQKPQNSENKFEKIIKLPICEEDNSFDFLKECQDLKRIISGDISPTPISKDDTRLPEIVEDNVSLNVEDNSHLHNLSVSEFNETNDLNETNDDLQIVNDSDIFDIYEDNDMEEFGHVRNVSKETKNYKENTPSDVASMVDNLEASINNIKLDSEENKSFYLASCCKKGNVCVWKWGGILVMSQVMYTSTKSTVKRNASHAFGAVHWITSNTLLASSKESQLLCCSLMEKLKVSQLHNSHKRGLFCITSVNNLNIEDKPMIAWTASMDRLFTAYSFEDTTTMTYSTFGGFVYDIQASPIDSKMFAIGNGDGMVRVIRLQQKNDVFQVPQLVKQLWNGIHGKVVGVSWHPTKENCLAFATYEGRIGLLNIATGAPAKILPFVMSLGVYNICWGLPDFLFACGNSMLVVYDLAQMKSGNLEPQKIHVKVCGTQWDISTITWSEKFLSVGSKQGGFALLNPQHPYDLITETYPHKKTINCISWHPTAVADDDGVSPFNNLVAISANKSNIIILKLTVTEDAFKLELYQEIVVNTDIILHLCWSPYQNGRLLTTSHDCTVNIWDVENNILLHTFIDHQDPVYSAAWCSESHVISGSGDCTLRIWDSNKHPALEQQKGKEKQKKKISLAKSQESNGNVTIAKSENTIVENITAHVLPAENDEDSKFNLAKVKCVVKKGKKKLLPLNLFWKQYKKSTAEVEGCRRLFNKLVALHSGDASYEIEYENGFEYLKIYEKHDRIMQLMDVEQNNHKETFNLDAYAIVGILQGNLRDVLEYSSKQGKLTPSLLSLAPSISHRFWKEMLTNYCSQLEYDDSKKSEENTGLENCAEIWHGLLLLISGQIEEACSIFGNVGLEPEAICASRARQADHIAEKYMQSWIKHHMQSGQFIRAAECYLSLGLIMEAATVLGKLNGETELALAAEMAKYAGNTILAKSFNENI